MPMINIRKTGLILSMAIIMVTMCGCGIQNTQIPLPTSASNFINISSKTGVTQSKLPINQISIPFPYKDVFASGIEQWVLETDATGKIVLAGIWIPKVGTNNNKNIAIFPIEGIGDYPLTGELTLGGKTYEALSIHVNNEDISTGSGWFILQEKSF
jgi:hypothetical protein